MATETVRIQAETYAKLKQLADELGQSMVETLEQAVDAYRRQQFLEGLNQDFAALRSDAKAWEKESAERAKWDATSADGLED